MPPVEERVPAFTVAPPLSDKSAPPVIICSVEASRVTGCAMLNPAIALSRVKAKLAKSSVPNSQGGVVVNS